MESFLFYLLRASVVMALFYGFYKLFFGKNTFHRMNRILLVLLSIAVCMLPLFRFSLLPEKKQEPIVTESFTIDFSGIPVMEYIGPNVELQMSIPWQYILFALFVTGLAFAVTRYLIGLLQLTWIIRKSERQTLADNSVLCVTEQEVSPFSWFNYIVLSRNDMNADNRTIINHERAHIHLLHSVDMVFFDLFTCLFWFNPFSWLLRREMQSVHEYQADDRVIQNGIDVKQYQLLLIRKSVGEHKFSLANNFRQRDLHKRIQMMTKSKTDKRMRWGYSVALPMLFLAMVALSVPKLNAKAVEKEADNMELTAEKMTISGQVLDEAGKAIAGVAVVIKGSTAGTVTDTEGKFAINADKGDVLQFMMVGYKLFEYKVEKTENNLVISLQPEEVLVVGSAKREDVEIDKDKELGGKTVVRGTDALKGEPLFFVDGEEVESLNDVDPDDIESISVLKSKSAIELYGEKGKDGVIIIATKKGKDAEEKVKVATSINE